MDLSKVKIAKYSGQKIWMVRASQGKYFQHFRYNNVLSIGHLDGFYEHVNDGRGVPSKEEVLELMLRKPEFRDEGKGAAGKKLNGHGTSTYNQIIHFLHDVKKGDLIVTLNGSSILIGVCTSNDAFFSSDELESSEGTSSNVKVKLDQRLRRNVMWGPAVPRSSIGGGLKKAFQSRQTVVNLTPHWIDVFGLIYPFVFDGSRLHFSTHIGLGTAINGKVISKLFENLSNVELIAKSLLEKNLDADFVKRLLSDDFDWDEYKVTTKAQFMSPGDIYSSAEVPLIGELLVAIKLVAIIFLVNAGVVMTSDASQQMTASAKSSSDYSPSALIDERNSPRLGTSNLDRMLGEALEQNSPELNKIADEKKVQEVKSNLKITIPTYDTEILEKEGRLDVVGVKSDEK